MQDTAGNITVVVQGVGAWLSVIATVRLWGPVSPQVYCVTADVALANEPDVVVQAKVSVSPTSASLAITETSMGLVPVVDCGAMSQPVSAGQ